jgi:hypothetical protein
MLAVELLRELLKGPAAPARSKYAPVAAPPHVLWRRNIKSYKIRQIPVKTAGFFGNRLEIGQSEACPAHDKTFACQFNTNTSILRRSGNLRTWEDLE